MTEYLPLILIAVAFIGFFALAIGTRRLRISFEGTARAVGAKGYACEEHLHEWMLASDSQLHMLCQHPGCDEQGIYVGDPLTTEDVKRLTGTKPAY